MTDDTEQRILGLEGDVMALEHICTALLVALVKVAPSSRDEVESTLSAMGGPLDEVSPAARESFDLRISGFLTYVEHLPALLEDQ